ncbi:SPRY-domain-containing protein [Linderina pennispora]|uniref:SPRY-domain-containing protein n=1 Tax=Linderina pennispora TaxID=61395 RepID=A0A1Y1W5S4_9FUNG|nr:SPRY-domain-containing protein [Linderina pennispora]ORX68742.1 SPRY-domain-containing protein [Linderina pennispora]
MTSFLAVGADRVSVRYTGPGKGDSDARMIRSDHPIPARCGVYYYEVFIRSRGQCGYIGIGLSHNTNGATRLPGWDPGSWGYHGDDGNCFSGNGSGRAYGPGFTTDDTVGCGIDFKERSIFFTRNGLFLGHAFKSVDTSKPIFPAVGMRTAGEHIVANFGQRPFRFDIECYVSEAHQDALAEIHKTSIGDLIPKPSDQTTPLEAKNAAGPRADNRAGHSQAAARGWTAAKPSASTSARADIDSALGMLQESYPQVLKDESLVFQLRCRQFIELVRAANGYHIADCIPSDDSLSSASSGSMMDVDDTQAASLMSLAAITNAPAAPSKTVYGQIPNLRKLEPARLVRILLDYGRQLQADYGASPNPIVREGLVHTFSLLAYADPAASPISALLDPEACKPLARLVECAIVATEKAPRMSALECIYRQCAALLAELSSRRNGAAALVSVDTDFV